MNHWEERVRNATFLHNSSEPTSTDANGKEVLGEEFDEVPSTNEHSSLRSLRQFVDLPREPTVEDALAITRLISAYHNIPWKVCFTVLNHEGGVLKRGHPDGAMQTTKGVRKQMIPRIPGALKLVLLGLQANAPSDDTNLTQRITALFRDRLAIQIATGIQELKENLKRFNGYVALALQAYNAGAGWAYYTVTRGQAKSRPPGVTDSEWENMCRFGAAILHQSQDQLRIERGVWQCDKNIPAWSSHIPIYDRHSGLQLIAFKYLRRITERIAKQKPALSACTASSHKRREPGSGPIVTKPTRPGTLDKLYNPRLLGSLYYQAASSDLIAIKDDGLPLKATNGRLIKKPLVSTLNQETSDLVTQEIEQGIPPPF